MIKKNKNNKQDQNQNQAKKRLYKNNLQEDN